ncbi:lipid-A-disaccharide synthase [Lutimaribacter sp. EGI FJ00015]|uniref:Lipid-A-disaccharide synthase n=1 Tax=Lutimaribacter degradans TaxID=2945989 RepID=A0ACC5ZWQ2_9RHOB|nr:lipid-A-disaccharide synthase [Lutimaribacter sp. EGI FJ00013]MCM2562467.1 lipid-A-disaccharide synthase [Lutimaribacter sp. EGI FJ00013]MCO0613624.1 lipid-A-disaccharide synthase [Lutimaribacter sp. EGI FJ00015]MCO0636596.1 lipid-A-disaccharide synthase [Lutimaribacter sp. EGI FJ00014]
MTVFLIAGEASGDRLGAALMAGLKTLHPEVTFQGVAGPQMQAEGMESLFAMEELSVMGLAEILPKYRHLKRRIAQTAQAVLDARPDVLITIDSPDFCLRVARQVKAVRQVRCVHYVAPTVWAWRPGRADKMAQVIDQVLALFPFEPPYMEAAGMRCDFVGHPVVAEPVATDAQVRAFRAEHGLGDAPLLLLLPGSRRGEVGRLMPVFSQVCAQLRQARTQMRVVIPAVAHVAPMIEQATAGWEGPPIVLDPRGAAPGAFAAQKRAAFAAANVALAASGTVSLELAANGTPMVIAYDMNWLSRQIISRMVRVDTVTLVNLVSETRAVPEFIGARCRADLITPAVAGVLDAPDAQRAAMDLTMERLGRGQAAPGLRAAEAVLSGLGLA